MGLGALQCDITRRHHTKLFVPVVATDCEKASSVFAKYVSVILAPQQDRFPPTFPRFTSSQETVLQIILVYTTFFHTSLIDCFNCLVDCYRGHLFPLFADIKIEMWNGILLFAK